MSFLVLITAMETDVECMYDKASGEWSSIPMMGLASVLERPKRDEKEEDEWPEKGAERSKVVRRLFLDRCTLGSLGDISLCAVHTPFEIVEETHLIFDLRE